MLKYLLAWVVILLLCIYVNAQAKCPCAKQGTLSQCCDSEGISYCDSSAGHYVCKSGGYSQCICTTTAISNLQFVRGCCLWHGGVIESKYGEIICADGTLSPICSIQDVWMKENYVTETKTIY